MRTGTTASWTSVRENPSGVLFKRSEFSRSVTCRYKQTFALIYQTSVRFISGQFQSSNKRVLINMEAENNCQLNISLLFAPARKLLLQSTALVWITDLHLVLKYLIYASMICILYSIHNIQYIHYIMNNCCML